MEIREIEGALFQMARLPEVEAGVRFPLLSQKLLGLAFAGAGTIMVRPSVTHTAKSMFDLLRELREGFLAPELIEEMKALNALAPEMAQ
jgi:hypothetical protein